MRDGTPTAVQTSYDRVAEEYVARLFGELEHQPLDRQLLDRFAARVQVIGTACDLGCGPGHVARYLLGLALGTSVGFGTYIHAPIPLALAWGWFTAGSIKGVAAGAILGALVTEG